MGDIADDAIERDISMEMHDNTRIDKDEFEDGDPQGKRSIVEESMRRLFLRFKHKYTYQIVDRSIIISPNGGITLGKDLIKTIASIHEDYEIGIAGGQVTLFIYF